MEVNSETDDVVLDESNTLFNTVECPVPPHGLGYEYFIHMKKNGDHIAQCLSETDEVDTYSSLLRRSIRTALHLQELKLTKDDAVLLSTYNHINSCVPVIACLFSGIKVASLDPSFTLSEVTHLIKLMQPKLMIIDPEVLDTISLALEQAEVKTTLIVHGEKNTIHTPFADFLKPHKDEDTFEPVHTEDLSETAIILFSSGTTGLPKGISLSHKTLWHQEFLMEYLGSNNSSVNMLFSTFYWVSSVVHLLRTIRTCSTRVVCAKFHPTKIWDLVKKYKIVYFFMMPFQAYQMLEAGLPDDVDLSTFFGIVTGGTWFNADKMTEFRKMLPGKFIVQSYGMTEFCGLVTLFNIKKTKDRLYMEEKPGSSGRLLPGFKLKIVDLETNKACGPNQQGELRILSDYTMNGYYREDSSDAFDSEGWLRTGDIGYFDEDYCLFIVDRIKELLKYRYYHVIPAAIEKVIQTHPAVKFVTVTGVPDEIKDDLAIAFIILKDEYKNKISAEEIQDFVAERVNDSHKLRGGVKFVDSFPMTPSNKVKRYTLRKMYADGRI